MKIIEYQKDLDPSQMAFCENARLLCINGSGAFSYSRLQAHSKWYEEYLVEVELNGVPLWRVNQSVCPTCESILATGMGIEHAGAKEFREIADRINSCGENVEYTWTEGESTYLYLTQSAACYNEERVQYYVEQFQKNDIPPGAIAYHCSAFYHLDDGCKKS